MSGTIDIDWARSGLAWDRIAPQLHSTSVLLINQKVWESVYKVITNFLFTLNLQCIVVNKVIRISVKVLYNKINLLRSKFSVGTRHL